DWLRSLGGAASLSARRRDVSRPHRRAGGLRRAVRQRAASLYPRAARRRAGTRSERRGRPQIPTGERGGAEPDQSADGLRVSSALPDRGRELQPDPSGAPGGASRPLGGLQRGALTGVELRRFDAEIPRASLANAVEDGSSGYPDDKREEAMIRKSGLAAAGLGAVLCIATAAAPAAAGAIPKRGGTLTYRIPDQTSPNIER